MSSKKWSILKRALVMAILAITINALILWDAPHPIGYISAFLLTCLLPGYLVTQIIFPRRSETDILDTLTLSLGAGYASLITGGLVVHYLPGPITTPLILIIYDAIVLVLLILFIRLEPSGRPTPIPKSVLIQVSLVMAIAAFFCLTYLGYSEFQGDEAIVMLKATAAVQGDDHALFVHKKGPAEILIPAILYASQGHVNEWMARLPFALAALAGLLTVFQLGRSMFNPFVGLMACLLLAINGFFMAFARIVQYQSLVFFMSALALFCCYRFFRDEASARRYLFLGTLFLGVGLLAQYDAIFVSPALGYLIFRRWKSHPDAIKADLKVGLGAVAACAVLLAAFYVPMVQHPYFHSVSMDYWGVRVGQGIFQNTLPTSFVLSTFYNSTYYIGFLALALASEVVRHLISLSRRWVGVLLSLLFIGGSVLVLAQPQWWLLGDLDVTLFFLSALLLVPMLLRTPSVPWKAAWLWFFAPIIFYTCLVRFPRTHFQVAFPALILLAAVALDRLRLRLRGITWQGATALGFAALYCLFSYYVYMVFVQHEVEYKSAYPASKPSLYWTTYDQLPSNSAAGWFGFPYKAGWKTIGALYASGKLRGDYDSNEQHYVTQWYTRGAPRCPDNPRYYFLAENPQERNRVSREVIETQYQEIGQVTVAGQPRIKLYEKAPPALSPTLYAAEDYEAIYDRELSDIAFNPSIPYGNPLRFMQHPKEANFERKAKLLGYSLDDFRVQPGGLMVLTLYWQALATMDRDYQIFVHVEREGRIWAQWDHAPGLCNLEETTSTWQPGQIIMDRFIVPIDGDAPPGNYPLMVGLYDWQSLQRLEIIGPSGKPEGNSVLLQEVEIRETL